MKKLIILIILLTPLLSSGQGLTNTESKFSMGVNFSPNYCYRIIEYSEDMTTLVNLREKHEHPSFGFNTGIAAQYLLTQKLEIELGLQYSRQTHLFKDAAIFAGIINPTTIKVDQQNRYSYIEIPLQLNYRFLNKKLFGYVSAGVSLNQFIKDKAKLRISYNNGETEVEWGNTGILDFNKTILGVLGGFGLGYHLNDKLNLRIEPIGRYSLTPLAEAPIEQYNYSIGCQVGVNLKL